MSVYIFGDTHAGIDTAKLSARQFPESKRLTENDYVIICGDFGFPFLPSDIMPESEKDPNCDIRSSRRTYRYWMDWFASKPFNMRDYSSSINWAKDSPPSGGVGY